jgi:hypothetical protein
VSAREEVQALLDRAQTEGRSSEYVAGLQDALVVVTKWQRSSGRTRGSYGPAANVRAKQRNKRRNDEMIERSTSRRLHYTYAEWLVVMDDNLNARQVADKLGRTWRGIETARRKLRRGYVPTPPAKVGRS